jgi:hypothetical protein
MGSPVVHVRLAANRHLAGPGRHQVVGIGWSAGEFLALRIPFQRALPRTAEYVPGMRRWHDDNSTHRAECVHPRQRCVTRSPRGADASSCWSAGTLTPLVAAA